LMVAHSTRNTTCLPATHSEPSRSRGPFGQSKDTEGITGQASNETTETSP
jgi:hypothetical protein